jgi:predicted aspartyl protease
MVQGTFTIDTPIIEVTVAWGSSIQTPFFILDTGFTGDLQVTPAIAVDLGLIIQGVTPMRIANGQTVDVLTANALAEMEGSVSFVQILISDSPPLAGISFLTKFNYKATVDCKNKTVMLERV